MQRRPITLRLPAAKLALLSPVRCRFRDAYETPSDEVGELNHADRLVAEMLAHIACVAILQDHPATPATVSPPARRVDQPDRGRSGQGLLSQRLAVSIDDAFTLLRRHARTHGDHLTELSHRLITEPEARQTILAAMRQMLAVPPSCVRR